MHNIIELSSTPAKEEEIIKLPSTPIYIDDSDEDKLFQKNPLFTGPDADKHISVTGSGGYTVDLQSQLKFNN